MEPTTRYAKSGAVHVAYQVFGEGPVDLVLERDEISLSRKGVPKSSHI